MLSNQIHAQGKQGGYQALATRDIELGPATAQGHSHSHSHGHSHNHNQTSNNDASTATAATAAAKGLTTYELLVILSPYFWPGGRSRTAWWNRLRSTSTWLMVTLSKACNLIAPFYLSYATNDLLAGSYHAAIRSMVAYATLRFSSSLCKELQSILYINVKQQAGIELQTSTFAHLHQLSLQWHVTKKTGSVMKSMDRGVEAASSIVSYMFLYLVPALAECLAVVILFFYQYDQYSLGISVFVGVTLYASSTIAITQWRKKFREQSNKHDNEFHERATDSILNYETVKYFTNEKWEVDRFADSVEKYQVHMSATSMSLNLLNITQQVTAKQIDTLIVLSIL
jgi:ATP-binding cassette, subfamily B, heavy metal transporter